MLLSHLSVADGHLVNITQKAFHMTSMPVTCSGRSHIRFEAMQRGVHRKFSLMFISEYWRERSRQKLPFRKQVHDPCKRRIARMSLFASLILPNALCRKHTNMTQE